MGDFPPKNGLGEFGLRKGLGKWKAMRTDELQMLVLGNVVTKRERSGPESVQLMET